MKPPLADDNVIAKLARQIILSPLMGSDLVEIEVEDAKQLLREIYYWRSEAGLIPDESRK